MSEITLIGIKFSNLIIFFSLFYYFDSQSEEQILFGYHIHDFVNITDIFGSNMTHN